MGKYQSRYKRAAKLHRAFNTILMKAMNEDSNGEAAKENNRKRFRLHHEQRELLDQTLGRDVLRELYWEGKEL